MSTPHPARDLLGRYRAIFMAAWQARHELAGPKRLAQETAFLPAALSLQETPPHPAPRRAIVLICALFVFALAWAVLGQVDVVAVAPGRLVVSEGSKLIQPLETSVVRAIHVRDGDRVVAGQLLVELDATGASADSGTVAEQLRAADSDAARSQALLAALTSGRAPALPALPRAGEGWGRDGGFEPHAASPSSGSGLQAGARTASEGVASLLKTEWQDISARLARLDAERTRRAAELGTAREQLAKLNQTVPLARQREADVQALATQGFMASHAGQDRTRERIELERDLATQHARVAEADAALAEGAQTKAAYLAETRRALADRHEQASTKRTQLRNEGRKTEQRERLTRLTSPVAGTVQQLAVRTPGGVATAAQTLLVVVPDDAAVTAEVLIENLDIGFVRDGQRAEVKLETFPFTRYGTVPAVVQRVTADAVNDEKRGAVFPATVVLEQTAIDVDGKRIKLGAGMNVTAEIKIGRRRVIEYLLSPIQRRANESGRER